MNAFDVTKLVVFTGMSLCYCSACYCVFHITAGLELAVDSFAVNCFSTGAWPNSGPKYLLPTSGEE